MEKTSISGTALIQSESSRVGIFCRTVAAVLYAALVTICLGCSNGESDSDARDNSPSVSEKEQTHPEPVGFHIDNNHPDASAVFAHIGPLQSSSLQESPLSLEAWQKILSVYVLQRDDPSSLNEMSEADLTAEIESIPPVIGEYRVEANQITFHPQFPFRAGQSYVAVFDPSSLPGATDSTDQRTFKPFTFGVRKIPAEKTYVTHIYPSQGTLPENLLKFYVHFSAPMSQNEAYGRIRMLDEQGNPIDLPFYELAEELWDTEGTRFTLLFDPGRIKRGLKPREEKGPAIQAGKKYTLVIDPSWKDEHGRELREKFTKQFSVSKPDTVQPDAKLWKLESPNSGTKQPLVILLNEPHDHALLQSCLTIVDQKDNVVLGRFSVDLLETRCQFTPNSDWKSGEYRLLIDTILEDRSGNSLGRPFEVDLENVTIKPRPPEQVTRPFKILPLND